MIIRTSESDQTMRFVWHPLELLAVICTVQVHKNSTCDGVAQQGKDEQVRGQRMTTGTACGMEESRWSETARPDRLVHGHCCVT